VDLMAALIRLQADPIIAELAAERLRQEGVPAEVAGDSDPFPISGAPMTFSLLVPQRAEQRAREILSELAKR